jgi:hypothetical protein
MREAREELQSEEQSERRFSAQHVEAQTQASAEAQAAKNGQVTPLMVQLCHAFGVYGPENCAQAYPNIAAHLR